MSIRWHEVCRLVCGRSTRVLVLRVSARMARCCHLIRSGSPPARFGGRTQFQDAIHPLGAAAILAAAALLVILSFASSTEWLPRWIGAGSHSSNMRQY